MKTLCLVMDTQDATWLPEFMARPEAGEAVIAALTFEGQLLASELQVPFKCYEDIVWSLDIHTNFDTARNKAHAWHQIHSLTGDPAVAALREFRGYPLFSMHESKLFLSFFEIISAFEVVTRIIQQEKPTRIFFGDRENPFAGDMLNMITGSGGVEREVAKALLGMVDTTDDALEKRLQVLAKAALPVAPAKPCPPCTIPTVQPGTKRILLFHYGGFYYLDFIEQTVAELCKQGFQVVAINIGEPLTDSEQAFFRYFNISCHEKHSWSVPDEQNLLKEWQEKAFAAAKALYHNHDLKQLFSTEQGSYYHGLAADALCRELFRSQQTIVELLRTEMILADIAPNAVIHHFATHPEETCFVLPFRRAGIPCITMEHGYNWSHCAFSNTFAADVFATNGSLFRSALTQVQGGMKDEVIATGSLRRPPNIQDIPLHVSKQALGLDPVRPLVVFCDNSVFPLNNEYRHKTSRVIQEVHALMAAMPHLQIVYRTHHGGNYQVLRTYFQQFRNRGLLFQDSLDIPLITMATVADLVIASASSAISEALLCGTPVIYLSALAVQDTTFAGWQAIRVVEDYRQLPDTVHEVLSAHYTRHDVLIMAQPFFDATMEGNRGDGYKRFAQQISNMASAPQGRFPAGFQAWLHRLASSAQFQSARLTSEGTPLITSGSTLPFVSVIMPAYNRAHMIGITLESFIAQDYPADRYEIIVSDNNSTDATKAVVLEWQKKSPVPISYIFEERQGVHFARNTAAKQSRGEILYFTDDDMIAEPNLLTEIVKVFTHDPQVGTATGRVLPRWEKEPPPWVLKLCYNGLLSIFDELGDGMFSDQQDFGVYSCHQAIRRDSFFKAGGYNPESLHTDYIGNGETGLNMKLKELGYRFGYNGKSVIYHMIPPARMTQDYLNKRLANQGSADSYTEYQQHRYSREQLAQRIREHQQALLERSAQAVLGRMHGGDEWRLDKAYAHYYLNRIEYDIRLMEDADWRELVLKTNWIDE